MEDVSFLNVYYSRHFFLLHDKIVLKLILDTD